MRYFRRIASLVPKIATHVHLPERRRRRPATPARETRPARASAASPRARETRAGHERRQVHAERRTRGRAPRRRRSSDRRARRSRRDATRRDRRRGLHRRGRRDVTRRIIARRIIARRPVVHSVGSFVRGNARDARGGVQRALGARARHRRRERLRRRLGPRRVRACVHELRLRLERGRPERLQVERVRREGLARRRPRRANRGVGANFFFRLCRRRALGGRVGALERVSVIFAVALDAR